MTRVNDSSLGSVTSSLGVPPKCRTKTQRGNKTEQDTYPLSFRVEHFGVAGEVHLHVAVFAERHCYLL